MFDERYYMALFTDKAIADLVVDYFWSGHKEVSRHRQWAVFVSLQAVCGGGWIIDGDSGIILYLMIWTVHDYKNYSR
jgi:hypothetical protein